MTDLRAVEPISIVPDPDMVEMLVKLIDGVESGDITSIAIATTNSGRRTGSVWHLGPRDELLRLIGEVVLLQDRLVQYVRDQNDGRVAPCDLEDEP